MCNACRFPAAPGDWADAGNGDAAGAARLKRLRIVETVISQAGFAIRCTPHALGVRLSGPSGHQLVVGDLDEIWPAMAAMTGRTFDPLDPMFTQFARAAE